MEKKELDQRIAKIHEQIQKHNQSVIKLENRIVKLQFKQFEKPTYSLKLEYTEDDKEIIIESEQVKWFRDTSTHKKIEERLKLTKNIALKEKMHLDSEEDRFEYADFLKGLQYLEIGIIFHIQCFKTWDNEPEDTPRYVQYIKIIAQNPLQLKNEEAHI
jgi:hypothetical protein